MDLLEATALVTKFDKCRVKHPKRYFLFSRMEIMCAFATNSQNEKLEPSYDPYAEQSEKKGMIISGPPGVGKSSLAQKYVAMNKPHIEETEAGLQKIVPVLYVQLPGQVTVKRVIATLLRALGLDPNTRNDEDTLTSQLITAPNTCRVKLIILDEVQHLASKKNVEHMPLIQNSLKGLINACDQFFVFVGDPSTPNIIKGCGQLGRRAPTVIALDPFGFPTTTDTDTFAIVNSLLEVMPSKTGISMSKKVDRLEFCQRLYLATNGVIDAMRYYMSESILDALLSGQRTIDNTHFESAYALSPSDNSLTSSNPFGMKSAQLSKWLDKALGYAS